MLRGSALTVIIAEQLCVKREMSEGPIVQPLREYDEVEELELGNTRQAAVRSLGRTTKLQNNFYPIQVGQLLMTIVDVTSVFIQNSCDVLYKTKKTGRKKTKKL